MELTKEDLQDLISTAVSSAVAATKAPTEKEKRELAAEEKKILQDNQNRARTAESITQGIQNKKYAQSVCNHAHKNGDTHCVYVHEKGTAGYLICQKLQCKIRPSVPKEQQTDRDAIYDTALFNQLFQKLPDNELFG
jgi:DNA mismatch repair ATPase MutL